MSFQKLNIDSLMQRSRLSEEKEANLRFFCFYLCSLGLFAFFASHFLRGLDAFSCMPCVQAWGVFFEEGAGNTFFGALYEDRGLSYS